jgi:hypothetical protein
VLALTLLAFPDASTGPTAGSDAAKDPDGHHEVPEDPFILVPRTEQIISPSAPVTRGNFHSIQINVNASGNNILGDAANEPSLGIDPTNPSNLVVGWRQFDTIASNFRQAGFAYSHDAGATWTFPGSLQPGFFHSDPVISVSSSGVFYYYGLSSSTSGDLFVSNDKGVTWSGPVAALGGDKEWMVPDDTGGIGDGNLYITWNSEFTCCAANTDFTRSIDGGATFQGPYSLPAKAKWGTLAVGPVGELYAAGTRIEDPTFPVPHMIMKSTVAQDRTQPPTFASVIGLTLGGTTSFDAGPNPGGLLGQVWVATDRSNGPYRGYVYVLASVDPPGNDPLDVMFIRSADGGVTWSSPVRVNDDPTTTNAYQWFGTMSVAPTGRIDAIWNDTRNDATAATSELRYAYSLDAGTTWSASIPVSPAFNSSLGYPNQNKIGDYYQMISDEQGASVVYAATFNGEEDVYFLRVGDCNANGVHDAIDIAQHRSLDCNRNGVPDECEETAPACSICSSDATCSDGVFCNGIETCNLATSRCQAPAGPSCDDQNACTTDTCNEAAQSCQHTPFPAPGEVPQTMQATSPTPGSITLQWSTVSGASEYNSYRGTIPAGGMGSSGTPYNHACLESADAAGDGATQSSDPGVPALGTARYYLADGENACGEGPLGNASSGAARPNASPCPTPP